MDKKENSIVGNPEIGGHNTWGNSELRDRIRLSGVKIKIIDRPSRFEYNVEPRQYEGRLIHGLSSVSTTLGDVYVELYLSGKAAGKGAAVIAAVA